MEKTKVDDPTMLLRRYESLKKLYFNRKSNRIIDDEGQEVPNAISKELLIKQFENIGAEIPTTPDQPFTPIQFQQQE